MWYFTNAEQIAEVFTPLHIISCISISIVNAVLLFLISYKFLQVMQQSGYEGFGYFKWLRRRDNIYLNRLLTLTTLSLVSFLIFNIAFAFADGAWIFYAGFVFYILFLINYYLADKKRKKKIPIVYTSRMIRLMTAYYVFLFIFTFALLILMNLIAFYCRENSLFVRVRFAPVCFMPLLVPLFVLIAYYITKPYELYNQKRYIKQCKEKLKNHKNLIKIGITGSYGKTSVKRILCTLLEEKFKVLATPASYNTPMGICKAVKELKADHQVFIAEMGARRIGDIKALTQIVEPDFAIINGIVEQHLESFGSLKAVKQTKFELVEHMKGGTVAYTVDNEHTLSMFDACKIKSIPTGITTENNPKVYAKNIQFSESGTDFILNIFGNERRCHTKLLGKHSISNICLAVAIAHELGLTDSEICAGISRLTAVEHRLSISKTASGITIIDDSYNSNPRGFDAALEVLSFFEGRKIVVTPGIVELGVLEDMINYDLGKKLAKSCDLAVLVGRSGAYIIRSGMLESGFDMERVIQASTLDQAMKKLTPLLKSGDIVLFENDLPDKFD